MKIVCAKTTENKASFSRDFIKFLFKFLESQGAHNFIPDSPFFSIVYKVVFKFSQL